MHGDDPERVQRPLSLGRLTGELVGGDSEPRAVELAAEQHRRTLLQLLRDPVLVEPDRLHRAAGVGNGGLDDPEVAPAGRTDAHRADLDEDGGLFADPEVGDVADLAAVAVAVREAPEEVAEGVDSELLGGGGGEARAGAFEGGQRGVEKGWARVMDWRSLQRLPVDGITGADGANGVLLLGNDGCSGLSGCRGHGDPRLRTVPAELQAGTAAGWRWRRNISST